MGRRVQVRAATEAALSSRDEQFAAAVAALLADVANRGTFAQAEMEIVVSGLSRYLRVTIGGLNHDELTEIVDTALLGFLEAARAGRVDEARGPAGYLIQLAHWRGLDFVRARARHEVPTDEVDEEASEVDLAAETVEALSSESEIAALIRHNRLAGRHDLNAVLRAWLNLEDRGQRPTVRAVADSLGVAASTVSARLAEIREVLAALRAG